jgi:yecA family protein
MSSLAKRYRLGSAGRPDPGELMPPDPRTFGGAPFGDTQRARLTAWLREGGWPRGHMEMAELEGYLLALIVWPVGISAGAWLPPIWGGRGWRVPKKLAARAQYDEFVGLIVGFMRDLDARLLERSRLETSVLRNSSEPSPRETLHRWGRGFMTALTLGSQGLKWRSVTAGDAVRLIAASTSSGAAAAGPRGIEDVVSAILVLAEQRPGRGPLGSLETATLVSAPIE